MALDHDMAILRNLPLFAQLSPDALRLLVFSSKAASFGAGARLCGDGALDGALVVMAGTAEVAAPAGSLRAPMKFPAPLLLGATLLIVDGAQVPHATATTVVTVLQIPRAVFRRILDEYPDDALKLQAALAADLAAFTADLARHDQGRFAPSR